MRYGDRLPSATREASHSLEAVAARLYGYLSDSKARTRRIPSGRTPIAILTADGFRDWQRARRHLVVHGDIANSITVTSTIAAASRTRQVGDAPCPRTRLRRNMAGVLERLRNAQTANGQVAQGGRRRIGSPRSFIDPMDSSRRTRGISRIRKTATRRPQYVWARGAPIAKLQPADFPRSQAFANNARGIAPSPPPPPPRPSPLTNCAIAPREFSPYAAHRTSCPRQRGSGQIRHVARRIFTDAISKTSACMAGRPCPRREGNPPCRSAYQRDPAFSNIFYPHRYARHTA